MERFLLLQFIFLWTQYEVSFYAVAIPSLSTKTPLYIKDGESLNITCEVVQNAAAVTWSRNGFGVLQITNTSACSFRKLGLDTYNYSVTCDQQKRFSMVKYGFNSSDDNTTWSCQVYTLDNTNLGNSAGVRVYIYIPVDSVQLKNGTTLTLIENQSAALVCETAACRPSAAIYWMKNGINITDSPLAVTAVSVGSEMFVSIGTLNYTGQRGDDGTLLTCGAYNGLGSVKTSGNLTITIYYTPSIEGVTSPYKVIENEPINVTCQVTSKPPADRIFWTPRGEGSVNSTLYFSSVSRNKSGFYNCTAQNTMTPTVGTQQTGISTSQIVVDVLYGAAIVNLYVSGGNTVNENSSAIFNCLVESNPPSTITWMKEGSSDVLKTESGIVQSNYTIKSAECLEMGNYTCSAYNGIWATSKERLELVVRCHPRTDFRLSLETKLYRKHHDEAILRYTVIAYPPPIFTWTFLGNGSKSRALPVSASQHDNGQQSELRITNLNITDFGNYSVIANNSVFPSATVIFEIIQADVPEVPSYVMIIEITQTSVKVQWMAGYNGGPQQIFHIVASAGSSTHNVTADDPGYQQTGMAVLNGLLPGTKYSIYVIAINLIGTSNITQAINVTTLEEQMYAAHVDGSSNNVYEGLSNTSSENAYDTLGAPNGTCVEKDSLMYVNLKLKPLTNKNGEPNIGRQNHQTEAARTVDGLMGESH